MSTESNVPSGSADAAPERLAIDTVRVLAMDAVQRAGSGHPGTAMALAPAAYALWTRFLSFDPAAPDWPDRDRFVLSCGHASILQYAALHLAGYDLPMDQIRRLRRWGSITPGHPEHGLTPGIETTTGPLGQGLANAVGFAMAERFLAERYNRDGHTVVDHRTWVFASDGDIMEGVAAEAASIAGHLRLGKLTVLYDDNHITIDGSTEISLAGEDVGARFAAYGWHVRHVTDANDVDAIAAAYQAAIDTPDRPSFIRLRSHIAWGAPNAQDTPKAHGAPLGEDEVRATKLAYGWDPDLHFHVPDGVYERWAPGRRRGERRRAAWLSGWDAYVAAQPELAGELTAALARKLPEDWDADLDKLFAEPKAQATRKASGAVLNALALRLPLLLGGSADLAESNNTNLKGERSYGADGPGRVLHFGVREHAMGAITNGLVLHGGLRPFAATFLIFSDYMRAAVRLAALQHLPTIYVWTHDSVGLGGDGPTHQPVEHLAALRAMPGLHVVRPADGPETAEAWRAALTRDDGPTAIVLTRQDVPAIDRGLDSPDQCAPADGLHQGAYVLAEAEGGRPRVLLLASGSEVGVALGAREALQADGIPTRVVSMPCWELFEARDAADRDEVLPPDVPARLAVEAASPFGWHRWVGPHGEVLGIDDYGYSAPGEEILERLGFTPGNVAARARALLGKLEAGGARGVRGGEGTGG